MADTIKQKILFQMGTTGTSQATKSFGQMAVKVAAVGAAITVAVRGMSKLYDEAVQLDRQLKALNTDMGLYNTETKGLIGTNDGLSAAIQLQNANIKASAEEMAALGKAAIQMNQQLGGGPEGATTQFNSLVKSIVNARETGLVKFGVELSQTADKTAASQEALQKLTEKFGDVNVQAETAKEKMFAFNNSLGTIAASEFNGFLNSMNGLLQESIEFWAGSGTAMQDYENDIMATKGAISEYMWTMDGMSLRGATWIASIMGNKNAVASLNDEYRDQVDLLTELATKRQMVKEWTSSKDLKQQFLEGDSRSARIAGRKLQAQLKNKAVEDMNPFEKQVFNAGILDADLADPIKRKKRKRKGGGGGKKAGDTMDFTLAGIERHDAVRDDMTFTESDVDSSIFSDFSGGGVDTLFGGGVGDLGLQDITNQKVEMQQNMFHSLLGMERQYLAESNRLNAQSNQQKAESAQAMGSAVGSTFSNLSKSMNAESEKGFNAMKAMAYAGNIVETTLAATAAFRSVMQTVPFPANVIMAPILAGSVAAMGAANGRKIRQQKYGTSGSPSVATAKTSFPTGGLGAGSGDGGNNYVFNVNVDGNTIHKSMINANDLANQSGEKHFATGAN
jgi:hypothetical protein